MRVDSALSVGLSRRRPNYDTDTVYTDSVDTDTDDTDANDTDADALIMIQTQTGLCESQQAKHIFVSTEWNITTQQNMSEQAQTLVGRAGLKPFSF